MTTPTVEVPISRPIQTTKDHPRFSGEQDAPATKKIDTEAARERVTSARNAARASDKAPRGRKPAEKAPAAPITYTPGMFRAPITALYGQAGGLVQYVAYPIGSAMVQQAGPCGEAWDKVAKQNPTVRRWLHSMTQTGAWGELFAAHLPILMTALMTLSPAFRDRMGGMVADSMETMTQGDPGVQDPN